MAAVETPAISLKPGDVIDLPDFGESIILAAPTRGILRNHVSITIDTPEGQRWVELRRFSFVEVIRSVAVPTPHPAEVSAALGDYRAARNSFMTRTLRVELGYEKPDAYLERLRQEWLRAWTRLWGARPPDKEVKTSDARKV